VLRAARLRVPRPAQALQLTHHYHRDPHLELAWKIINLTS
jgi:hypothetical protein